MKKLIIIFLISVPLTLSAYTWSPFGPSGIHANDIIFNVGTDNLIVICANEGLYISDDGTTWDHYTTSGLPVKGAIHNNDTSFIFIMGDGSWSDGIYLFSLNTLQHTVLEWAYLPEFIYLSDYDDQYYVGFNYGLLYSDDITNWGEIPYFSGKTCVWMDCSYNYYIVAQNDTVHDIHYSSDAGKKWMPTNCPYGITDFRFKCTGELYGVFPGYSNSSGLYYSTDYGLNWTLETYSDNMNTVGYDACVNVFVGWESPGAGGAHEGVAIWNPVTQNMDFINNGLPNKYINKLRHDPLMSSIAMFACTDGGVYILQSYVVGTEDFTADNIQANIFPNPFIDYTTIEIPMEEYGQSVILKVYSSKGSLVRLIQQQFISDNNQRIKFYREGLKAGVYYIRIETSDNIWTEKVIIR